ncbi:copper chaperone [Algoriella xinjiangensis]|uniref:Copper chaperone n=1 Tax=Algoriella xinjiangensis TaxID=684065 RepID=A0A1I4S9Y1_9FLAO|nr:MULTISPECIES: cation transporter [Algoriella]MBO6213845.1 cation transporter [Algoriella sp.]SFM61308.1 copper chaperone [Algoriella xinjiangensis]VDH15974.1 Copper chaperone [Algoriella xinjiangensis]
METNELKFKTNINCSGCVSKVKPFLDNLEGVEAWEVDTDNVDKILTVKTKITDEDIIDTIEEVGFKAELIQ